MRRAAKRDDNEAAIAAALERAGCSVTRLSAPGVPDLLVGWRGAMWLLEVKAPLGPKGGAGGTLTPEQERWWAAWKGPRPTIVRTAEDALWAVGVTLAIRRGAIL